MLGRMAPNSKEALARRRDAGTLTWRGPALILFARTVFAVPAQAVAAGILALRGSPSPWLDAAPWFPLYASLIDAGCLAVLWRATRREGIRLFDLVGFERHRLARDVLLGLGIIPIGLALILAGTYGTGWLLFGEPAQPYFNDPLPLAATLYGVVVFPILWGLTEQMTYNGYLLPRLQILSRSTALAVAFVAFVWSAQHAFMPTTLDPGYMAFRLISPLPFSIFQTLLYLRLRRLIPFIVAHALMDGATVVIGSLLPLLRA